MKEILESSIDFSKLGNYKKEDIEMETKKAVISRESGILSLELELNFVLPWEAVDKFKRSITGRVNGIKGLELEIRYRDLVQTTEEALRFYIGHMIALVNGKYAHVTKTIYTDKWELGEDELVIYALGQTSVDILNRDVAQLFEKLLKNCLFKLRGMFKIKPSSFLSRSYNYIFFVSDHLILCKKTGLAQSMSYF